MHLLLGAAQPFHHMQLCVWLTVFDQPLRQFSRGRTIAKGADHARAATQERQQPRIGGGMQPQAQYLFQLPAQVIGRQGKAGGRRIGNPFMRVEIAHQRPTRAVPKRIARGQYHDLSPPHRQNWRGGKRHRPGLAPVTGGDQLQVARPTKDHLGLIQRFAACICQARQAILTQTNHREPGGFCGCASRIRHDTYPCFGRHHRSLETGPGPGGAG